MRLNIVLWVLYGRELVDTGQINTEFIALDWWAQQSLSLKAEY